MTWPTSRNGVAIGLGSASALANTPNTVQPSSLLLEDTFQLLLESGFLILLE